MFDIVAHHISMVIYVIVIIYGLVTLKDAWEAKLADILRELVFTYITLVIIGSVMFIVFQTIWIVNASYKEVSNIENILWTAYEWYSGVVFLIALTMVHVMLFWKGPIYRSDEHDPED